MPRKPGTAGSAGGSTSSACPTCSCRVTARLLEAELPEVVPPPSSATAPCASIRCRRPRSRSPGGRAPAMRVYNMLSGRRAVVERAVASVAEGTPGLEVRRGVAVAGLLGGAEAIGRGAPCDGRAHERRRGGTGRPGRRLRRPPLGAPGLAGGAGRARPRTRSTTAASSTSGDISVPVTVSCRWHSGPAFRRTAPFRPSCSRPTTAPGRSPSRPGREIGLSAGSRIWIAGNAPCGRFPRSPIGSRATRSRTAS